MERKCDDDDDDDDEPVFVILAHLGRYLFLKMCAVWRGC
jgi:hypothetical protein